MVVGITMVKDEADVIEQTIAHMLEQVDALIVADNASTDGTTDILWSLAAVGRPITVIEDLEVGYYQAAKVTALAVRAAADGADWVVPFDADELWYSPFGRVADVLHRQPADVAIASARLYDHVATGEDPAGVRPFAAMGWRRREPAELPKVAARTAVAVQIEQGNHAATFPTETRCGELVVRHYPYRSPEQFVTKARNGAAAYAATDLPDHQGQHWRDYGRLLEAHGPDALHDVFRTYFWAANPSADSTLIYDPCPR
jgi:hypothetical protein